MTDSEDQAVMGAAAADAPIDEALHDEARRLAGLLVAELKLYHGEAIEEGRRRGDLYERLKDDIDRSRTMYEERTDPRLLAQHDYFQQELVRLEKGEELEIPPLNIKGILPWVVATVILTTLLIMILAR